MQNNLRVERAIKNVSQEQMAKDLNIHRQSVFAIESGRYSPSGELMLQIAKYFGKPVETIFWLDDEQKKTKSWYRNYFDKEE